MSIARIEWLARLPLLPLFILFVASGSAARAADYKDEAGFTRLQSELGPATPSGINVKVTQVEGMVSPQNYMPDTNDLEFVGKTFTDRTTTETNPSWHATTVGQRFYGNTSSFATNISTIDVYEVYYWLTNANGFLRYGSPTLAPLVESNHVQNHSWVGYDVITNVVRRFDYAIDRDGFVAVVALNNGSGTTIPCLLANSYNAIVVGRNDGEHSRGTTPIDEPGRVKPDLVAQANLVSTAVPTVASAAALLLDATMADQDLAGAASPQGIKAPSPRRRHQARVSRLGPHCLAPAGRGVRGGRSEHLQQLPHSYGRGARRKQHEPRAMPRLGCRQHHCNNYFPVFLRRPRKQRAG